MFRCDLNGLRRRYRRWHLFLPQPIRGIGRWALFRLRQWRHRGARFHCPVCRSQLGRFVPLPAEYRGGVEIHGALYQAESFETINLESYGCPVCGATDRARLYALYLARRLGSEPGTPAHPLVFLHFAPDNPVLVQTLRSHPGLRYRTADLYMADVDDRVDITDMPLYPDEPVDAFLCSHVLEHVTDDTAALGELYRILKPGGWGILMAPVLPGLEKSYEDPAVVEETDRKRHFGQEDHVRVYARADYVTRLEAAGFAVTEFRVSDFGSGEFQRCGICDRSILYVVDRRPT
jgi:SAM-dependent methyltransferase